MYRIFYGIVNNNGRVFPDLKETKEELRALNQNEAAFFASFLKDKLLNFVVISRGSSRFKLTKDCRNKAKLSTIILVERRKRKKWYQSNKQILNQQLQLMSA